MDAISGGIDQRWCNKDQDVLFRSDSGLAPEQPAHHRYVTQDWNVGSELLYVRFIAQAHEHNSLSVGDLGRRADLSKSKTRQRALRQCIWRDLGGRIISQELDLCLKKSQPNRKTIRGNIRDVVNNSVI